MEIDEEKYERLEEIIENIQQKKKLYKFNVIGLIAVALNVRIKREKCFYCAEFVKYVLEQSEVVELPEIIKPDDFNKLNGLNEVYIGKLQDYKS